MLAVPSSQEANEESKLDPSFARRENSGSLAKGNISVLSEVIVPENPFEELLQREQNIKRLLKLLSLDFLSAIQKFNDFTPKNKKASKTKTMNEEDQLNFLVKTLSCTTNMRQFHERFYDDIKDLPFLNAIHFFSQNANEIKAVHENYSKHCSSIMKSYAFLLRNERFKSYMDFQEAVQKGKMDFSTLLYEVFRHPVNLQLIIERIRGFCEKQRMTEELEATKEAHEKILSVNMGLNRCSSANELKIFEIHENYSSLLNLTILAPDRLYQECLKLRCLMGRVPTSVIVHVMNDLVLVVRDKVLGKSGGVVAAIPVTNETKVDDLRDQKFLFHLFRLRWRDSVITFKANTKKHKKESIDSLNETIRSRKALPTDFVFSSNQKARKMSTEEVNEQKDHLDLDVSIAGTRERYFGSFKRHTEYLVKIEKRGSLSYQFSRRYSDFLKLHTYLRKAFSSSLTIPTIPPKTFLKFSSSSLEIRRIQLEAFLYFILQNSTIRKIDQIQQFFGINVQRYFSIRDTLSRFSMSDQSSFGPSTGYSSNISSYYSIGIPNEDSQEVALKKIDFLNREEPIIGNLNANGFCLAYVDICSVYTVEIELSVSTRALEVVKLISEEIGLKHWLDFRLELLEVGNLMSQESTWRLLSDEEFIGISPKEFKCEFESVLKETPNESLILRGSKTIQLSKKGRAEKRKTNELFLVNARTKRVLGTQQPKEESNESQLSQNTTSTCSQKSRKLKKVRLRLIKYYFWDFKTEKFFMKKDKVRSELVLRTIAEAALNRKQKGDVGGGFGLKCHSLFVALTYLATTRNVEELLRMDEVEFDEYRMKNLENFLPIVIYSAKESSEWEVEVVQELRNVLRKIKKIEKFSVLNRMTVQLAKKFITSRFFFTVLRVYPQFGSRVYRVEPTESTRKLLGISKRNGYCLLQVSEGYVAVSNEDNSTVFVLLKYREMESFELKTNSIMIKEQADDKRELSFDHVQAHEIYELCLTYYELFLCRERESKRISSSLTVN